MKKDSKNVFKNKFVAVLVLLSQFTYLLPAQTFISEQSYDKQKLERYLDRASRERNAQDWERIAEEGIFTAMFEWESANTYLKESDYDKFEEEYNKVLEDVNAQVNSKFAYWYTEHAIKDNNNIRKSSLSRLLAQKSEEYKEQYNANGASLDQAEGTRRAWEDYANGVIDSYLATVAATNESFVPELTENLSKLGLSEEQLQEIFSSISADYNNWASSEYQKVYDAERNQLTAVLLYDTQSTKKLTATQAAEAVARETAQEVKAETDATINQLFNEFESDISKIEGQDLVIAQQNWLNNFQKAFDESLQKWNDAEKEYLVKRSEWEYEAESLYENNESAWAEGYKVLQQKKDEWFKDINAKLEKGRREWNQSEELLNKQLDAAKLEMQATFEKERDTKAKLLDVQIGLYEQSRSMLNIAAQGLSCYAESFEKYKNRYSYWKTEDNEALKSKVDELFETVKAFKKQPGALLNLSESEIKAKKSLISELAATCENESLKAQLNELTASDSWINYIITYKAKAQEAIAQLYSLTGCVYNETVDGEVTFLNELDIQILKSKVTLDYWNEEYEVALAVKEYAQSHSAETETDNATLENLNAAIAQYEAALNTYNTTVGELSSLLSAVDAKQAVVDQTAQAMNAEKTALENIQEQYAQILVVLRGANEDTLILKIANLLKDYNEIKNTDNSEDYEAYYEALTQYNKEVYKTDLYTLKNNLQNGKTLEVGSTAVTSETKSIQELTEYKNQISEFITNPINYDSQSQVLTLKEKLSGMQYYIYDEVNNILAYLEELDANKDKYTTVQKKQVQAIITQNLKLIEQYWQNEIDYRNDSLSYIQTGNIANRVAELTNEQINENNIRNYLNAVVSGAQLWKDEYEADLSKFDSLITVIKQLLETPSSSFISSIKTECENNSKLQLLLKQQNIFENTALMNWIVTETNYKNRTVMNKLQNQQDIVDFCSPYINNIARQNHSQALSEINQYIAMHPYTVLSLDELYEYTDTLRELGEKLNIQGQTALENYITGVIDYAGTKYAFNNGKTADALRTEIENVNNQFKQVNQDVNDLKTLAYSITDISSVLGLIKDNNDIYTQNKDKFIDYTSYLIMNNLFESDVKGATVNSLKAVIKENEEAFGELAADDQNAICNKILSNYNFISDYNNYKDTVQALDDYFYILISQNNEGYHLLFENAVEGTTNYRIYKANEFIAGYQELQTIIAQINAQIAQQEITINKSEAFLTEAELKKLKKEKEEARKKKQQLEQQLTQTINNFKNNLCDYAKNNNWYEKAEQNKNLLSTEWYSFYLAGEKELFIYLQSDYGYSYIDTVKNYLTDQSHKTYLDSLVKRNKLAYNYIDLLDGDAEKWVNSLEEELTEAEKAELIAALDGTGAITSYYNYKAVQQQLLNGYGAGSFVTARIAQYNNFFDDIISQKYDAKYEEYNHLQLKNAYLNSGYNAVTSNNVTWASELRNNDIGVTDFLDDDANEAIKKWVTNNNPVNTLLNEKAADIQNHYMYLAYNSSIFDTNGIDSSIPGAPDSYVNLLNNAYAKLYSKIDTSGLISEICNVNNSLKETKAAKSSVLAKAEVLKGQVATQKTAYDNAVTVWKNSVGELKTATENYNAKVTTADSQFDTLKQKEHAKRIAQEKYDYASSIYLKELGQINNSSYISPEEKLVDIAYSRQQAQITVEVLEELKTGYAANSEYTDAMNKYKTAVKDHYVAQIIKKESDEAIKIQEDNVREADQKLQEAYAKILMNPVSMKEVAPNMKLVSITKNADGSYSFRLAKDGRTCDEALMLEYFTKQQVPEKIVGGERNITRAVYDTREWIQKINNDRSYSENLMLAAVYFKYINGNISMDEFSCNELPQGTIQGINCEDLSKNYRVQIFQEAYNAVMGKNGGEEDLARYLIYVQDTSGANGGNNKYGTTNLFNAQLQDTYKIRLLNKLIDYCEPIYDGKIAESIAFFAEAAVWGATAAAWGWPACLIPAAVATGFTIAGGTALYKANVIKNDLITYMKNKINGLRLNVNSSVAAEKENFKDIKDAKDELKNQWCKLNKMLNGVDSEVSPAPNLTYVQNAMKERVSILANKNTYTADIDHLYTQTVFNASGAGSCETVADAIDKINLWYETQETVQQENLAHVVTKLQSAQNEKSNDFANEVNAKANLTAEQKNELHKLAEKAADEKLSAEDRAKAKEDFDKLSAQYLTKNKSYSDNLKVLAKAAWGTGTWHSDVYFKDQVELAKSLYSNDRINFSNAEEQYTYNALANYKAMALASFDQAVRSQMAVYEANQNKERVQLSTKRSAWENQMLVISSLAEVEWNKAGESLVSGYNEWKKKFIKEYNEKQTSWVTNYTTFLEEKQKWINEQFLYAVNMGNAAVLDNSGLDVETAISQALAKVAIDSISLDVIDPDKYTDELIAGTSLGKLMNSIESLQDRGKNAAVTKKHGSKLNATAAEALMNAQLVMQEMEEAIENAAARLAGEQAALLVEKSIEASMDRIDQENKAMVDWEVSLVQANGYQVHDKTIEREAVIDSTIAGAIYSHQTVAFYKDYTTSKPTLTVSLSKTMLEGLDHSAIMLLVAQANEEIEDWNTRIFGDTEKDEDGNLIQKQWTVPRSSAEAIHNSDSGSVAAGYKSNENAAEKKEYDALVKKGYAYLDQNEKDRFEELSSKLITVRDGELGEWIGYAPQFKDGRDNNGIKDEDNENLGIDIDAGREANIKFHGEGQMGAIMLDFQWNSILEGQGWGKLAQPMYDQALWYAGDSWFQPPTLRAVTGVIFEVVGTATGQKWFSYADDLIFAACDLGGGYKSAEEVGLQLVKTAATAAVSYGCSAIGSGISASVSTAMEGASKFANFAAQAGISMAQSYVSTVAGSAINCVELGEDGLNFNGKEFTKSLYSAGTIAGVAGAGVMGGLQQVTKMNLQANGNDGAATNKFYGSAINAGISAAGKATEYAVYSAYALAEGRTMADAFEDMGGLTFNIANLGIIADLIADGEGRNNATGQSGKWGKIADRLSSTGVLEINIGANGVTGQIGMGGFDLAGSIYDLATKLNDKAALEAYAQQAGVTTEEAQAALLAYIYGDRTQENAAIRIANGTDELHIVKELTGEDENTFGHTVQKEDGTGRIINMKADTDINNVVHLGHEAYRDGVKGTEQEQDAETFNAVVAHSAMGANMEDYGADFTGRTAIENSDYRNGNIFGLMLSTMMNYDSSEDFWKLLENGSLAYDGNATLRDSKGNIIKSYKDLGCGTDNQVETALIKILGLDKNDPKQVEKVQKMMALVLIHTYDKNPDNWYWKSETSVSHQEGVLGNGYPRVVSDKVTEYNMGKEITLDMILNMYNDIYPDATKDKSGYTKSINAFIKTVYNSPITMLNYTDNTTNATATSYLLNKVYDKTQMKYIKTNQIWYNGVIKNSQDIRSSMLKDKAKQSQGFGKQSEKIKLATSTVENAASLVEDHPGYDHGGAEKGSVVYTPGGYWQFLGQASGASNHTSSWNLYGSDLNMRIMHIKPSNITQKVNTIYGSSTGDFKLFDYPTESYGSGSGAHTHVEFTRLLPHDGYAYVSQYVDPNTFQPGEKFDYNIYYYDKDDKLIKTTPYNRNFGREWFYNYGHY